MRQTIYAGKLDWSGNLFIKDSFFSAWRAVKCEYHSGKPCGNWCKKFGKPQNKFIGREGSSEDDIENFETYLSICYAKLIFKRFSQPESEHR